MRQHHHHFVGAFSCLVFILGAVSIILGVQTANAQSTVNLILQSHSGGTITGPGINCGSDCSEAVAPNSTITLTATPNPGFLFSSGEGCPFNGGSSQPRTCDISVTSVDKYPWFSWVYASYAFTATTEGTGSGTITGAGTHLFNENVTLVAKPNAGSVFAGWQTSGDICYTGGGKGPGASVNPSPTCSYVASSSSVQSFNAVAKFDKVATSSPPTSTPRPTTTAPAPTTVDKPASPDLVSTKIGDQILDTTKPLDIAIDKPLILAGKTVPNGIIKLYIFSDPRMATVTADQDGNWTYTLTNLPAGDHHIEAEVTNPANNVTSERKNLIAFTVSAVDVKSQSQPVKKASTPWYAWVIGGLLLIGVGAGGFFYWWHVRKLHRSRLSQSSPAEIANITHPTEQSDTSSNKYTKP